MELLKPENLSPKDWDFPKLHYFSHLFDDILQKGVLRNFSTRLFEKKHGPLRDIYHRRTNFKNIAPQILDIQHQIDISDIIANEIKAMEQYLAQLKALEAPPEDSEVQEKLGGGHYTLGSKLKPTTIGDFCHLHNLPEVRFRVDLRDYMSKQLQAYKKPLPDGRWIQLKSGNEIRPFQFLKVNYESYHTWKIATDYLRCNPNFFGQPRYNFVIFTGAMDEPVFAQIKHLFVCELGGTKYALALVQPYKVVNLLRRLRSDRDYGLL
ncbi:hypothetical protein AAF712_013953 [Marasmius tenuissimus]|uniref:Uncharacterized protein n=1 Tax=Marasmius tenuissimus TaxID=585030 RepID=A0ABR2ZD87_9AGAR